MLKIYQLRLKQNSFEITLKYKGVGVRVAFVDGNTYNGTPAKCYTSDPFKQKAIEASQMFKDRDIVLERTVEDASDRKAAAQKAARVNARPARASVTGNKAQAKNPKPAKKPEPVKVPEPTKEPEPVKETETVKTDDGTTAMKFDNLGEAIQYIAQNFQIQVQTESEARKLLKEHGINPTIKKG